MSLNKKAKERQSEDMGSGFLGRNAASIPRKVRFVEWGRHESRYPCRLGGLLAVCLFSWCPSVREVLEAEGWRESDRDLKEALRILRREFAPAGVAHEAKVRVGVILQSLPGRSAEHESKEI